MRRNGYLDRNRVLTKLCELLNVGLVSYDTLAVSLCLCDSLLNGNEPSISLGCCLSLEGVLVSVELEEESNRAVFAEVSGISL